MEAAKKDFVIEKGTDWNVTLGVGAGTVDNYVLADITNLIPAFEVNIPGGSNITLTDGNGITKDLVNKIFIIDLTENQVNALTFNSSYEFEVVNSLTKKKRYLKGSIRPEDEKVA